MVRDVLLVRRLTPAAMVPSRAYGDDAAFDLYAIEDAVIRPGGRLVIGTGISVALPVDSVGLVVPRSGLAANHGITVVNAPGLVDAGYRGEVKVVLFNTDGSSPFPVRQGDRIAQLLVVNVSPVDVVEAQELPASARGANGLGSTGR